MQVQDTQFTKIDEKLAIQIFEEDSIRFGRGYGKKSNNNSKEGEKREVAKKEEALKREEAVKAAKKEEKAGYI